MAEEKELGDSSSERSNSTRITVTLPETDYEHVCKIAAANRVSASWVVRDAVSKYVVQDVPLFSSSLNQHRTPSQSTSEPSDS